MSNHFMFLSLHVYSLRLKIPMTLNLSNELNNLIRSPPKKMQTSSLSPRTDFIYVLQPYEFLCVRETNRALCLLRPAFWVSAVCTDKKWENRSMNVKIKLCKQFTNGLELSHRFSWNSCFNAIVRDQVPREKKVRCSALFQVNEVLFSLKSFHHGNL